MRKIGDREESSSAGWGEGRYSPESRAGVYTAMLDRAAPVVGSGRDVVLDASWSSRGQRDRAREWAAAHGARARFVEIRCEREVALERLTARKRKGGDPSDAGPELYDDFARSFDAVVEWPAEDHVVVHTEREGWQERFLEDVIR